MTTNSDDHPDRPGTARAAPDRWGADPIWRALQYQWLSTASHVVDLGLVEVCGSRHYVDLVVTQAEQGYWAGDFDNHGRAPSWLWRLRAREDRHRGRQRPGQGSPPPRQHG